MIERTDFWGANRNSNRRWAALCGAATFALSTSLIALAWDDAKPTQPAGLKGILPAEVPASIGEEAFAALEGNWKEWAEGAAAEVSKLYGEASPNTGTQRQQLVVIQRKLQTMEASLKDSRYASIHQTLGSLHAALSRRVALAEAVLDTLDFDPKKAATERLEKARQQVASSVNGLEAELIAVKNGPAWLAYVRSAEIVKLVGDKSGAKEALPVLTAVQKKLSPSDSTAPEVRQFLDGAKLVALRQALDNFVAVSAAVDQAWDAEKLRTELANLVGAVEKYEERSGVGEAAAVRKAFDAARKVAPDGGERLSQAMSAHYFNFNLRVVLSEKFLAKLATRTTTKRGPVDDFILGAKVNGNQVTTATVGIDLKPSNNSVRLNLTLNGVSQTSTVGVTEEATVNTSGYHQFWAWKPVTYDGAKFATGQGDIQVSANNTTTGVATGASGIPLFGGIADSIARGEVAKRRPQSEAIAAQRLSSRIMPEFNQEVDAEIAKMNQELDTGVNARLKKKDLFPSATSYRSTEDDMRANLRLMTDGELAGGDGPFTAVPANGFVVGLHESLLNNSMDRLKFAGRTMTEEQLKTEIDKSFSELLGREFNSRQKIDAAAATPADQATFIFPASDPIRFQLNNGQMTLIIRAGLKQKEGEKDIPTQEISVPLMFNVEGNDLVVSSGDIGVSPVEAPENAGLQIARSGVVRTKLKAALPTRKFTRNIALNKSIPTPTNIAISSVKVAGGWMVLSFE